MTRARDLADLASSGVIEGTEVADDPITLAKMASGTDGNIISYDASGNPVAIATGSDGQVLTSAGAGQPPAFESISTVVLSGSENNNIATVTGANALIGEERLQYNNNIFTQEANGSSTEFRQTSDGGGTYWTSLIASASAVKLFTRTASPLILGCNNAEKMRVANDGKVGIGETSPLGKLHVMTADSGGSVDGTSDELVIEGSGSSGMTILSGTSGEGGIKFGDSGDNDVGRIVYDHSSNDMFFMTSGNEGLRIDDNGKVGIGTTSPGNTLHVDASGGAGIKISRTSMSGYLEMDVDGTNSAIKHPHSSGIIKFKVNGDNERFRIAGDGEVCCNDGQLAIGVAAFKVKGGTNNTVAKYFHANTSGNENMFVFYDGAAENCGSISINCGSNTVAYNTSSDYRLKQDETLITDGIERVKQLKPYRFKWKSDLDNTVDGFFAHEVSGIVPEAISGDKDAWNTFRAEQE